MPVLKIKSTHRESQGDFVLIDQENYDPSKHDLYVENAPKPKPEPEPEPEPEQKNKHSKK